MCVCSARCSCAGCHVFLCVVDSCKKVGVVFPDVISTVEVIRSSKCQIQCTGTVPTFMRAFVGGGVVIETDPGLVGLQWMARRVSRFTSHASAPVS